MPIKFAQLEKSLAGGLKPLYLVAGAEPLLVQEAREKIIRTGREQGFEERELIQAERGFEWDSELGAASAPSLFAPKKIIDLRLPSGKPGRDGARALTAWAEAPDVDSLLVLSFGQWDSASRKSKWAQTLDKAGVVVEIWPLKPAEMPGWISQRLKSAGLAADREAVAMLAALVEGNLLAAQQEIDKIVMAGVSGKLTAGDIESAVANSSRFDAFRLAECALNGDAPECLRVSGGLQRNHVYIQPVAAALHNELALTEGLQEAARTGENERTYFGRARVWPMRQGPMKRAARRLSEKDFGLAFRCLGLIDLQGKGRARGNPWHSLERLLVFLCDPHKNRP